MTRGIDWQAAGGEVVGHLQQLLRIDTTNPPGNETAAARYLAGVLEEAGFRPEITESAPGRGNVTARLRGGGEPPLLLLGHTDVVAAAERHWTHPPFGGDLSDGYLWGRGALDMKNAVAAQLTVMLLLRRCGLRLNRDVLFAATADEEAGRGDHGPGWLLDHRPELIEASAVLTEGGGHDLRVGARRFTTCQVGQKGICRLRARAAGQPGHASLPHGDNAILHLCAALAPLAETRLPLHPSAPLRRVLEAVAEGQPAPLAADLRAVLRAGDSEAALARLPVDEDTRAELQALLRNTASVTMVAAGTKINVIPAEATAWIDGRLAPGQTQETFLAELRAALGGSLEFQVDQYSPPLTADPEGELFGAIQRVMARHDPQAPVVPWLSTGGTDAKHIVPRRPGTQVYGFMPYRQTPGGDEMRRIHGHDERTSVAELVFAMRVLFDIVCDHGGA